MSYNTQKPFRFVQDLVDAFTLLGLDATVSYDASRDIFVTVDDRGVNSADALIKVETIAQTASNIQNPVTGLASAVFVPHIIKVGFCKERQASGTATLTAVIATDVLTVGGVNFTAVAAAPAANQFIVGGTDTETAANLAAAINASVSAGVAGIVTATSALNVVTITAIAAGTGGNAVTLAESETTIAISGATLTGGSETSTSDLTRYKVLAEVFPKGTQVEIYEATASFVAGDFVDAKRVVTFRNNQWGNLVHI